MAGMVSGFDVAFQSVIHRGPPGAPGGRTWYRVTVRPRWPEWVIALSIAALFIIGVAAIWGAPIRRWVERMAGDEPDSEQPAPREGAGPTPTGQRL